MPIKPEVFHDKIVIPSDPALIGEVDDFIESRLRKWRVSDSLIVDIAICATEVVNNGINHGNKRDLQKTVTLELRLNTDKVVVTVTDQGGSFDPDEVEDPLDEKNLLREVGRGLFIVRSFMDSVEISRAANGGTIVTLTKRIA